MYVYTQKHTFSSFVCSAHLEKMTARKINMLGSQVSDSKYHPPFKESGSLKERLIQGLKQKKYTISLKYPVSEWKCAINK